MNDVDETNFALGSVTMALRQSVYKTYQNVMETDILQIKTYLLIDISRSGKKLPLVVN